jgi:hypothetical protein
MMKPLPPYHQLDVENMMRDHGYLPQCEQHHQCEDAAENTMINLKQLQQKDSLRNNNVRSCCFLWLNKLMPDELHDIIWDIG